LEEIVRRADVLSLHLPATEQTAGLIGERELSAMKSHAVLVNTSRGPLVDSNALARALREGGLGAAGLDVYENEPEVPPALLEAPRCVLLPHIGSATTRSRDGMARLVADNVLAVLAGGHAPNRVA
jgi:glyoxylate reductase